MKNKTFYFSKIMLIVLIFSNFSTNFLIAQPADSPWPMFRHDAQHTGRSSIIGPTIEPKLAWIFDEDLKTAPVIGADNTIYTANKVSKITYDESNLIALNSNGTVKWQYRLANNLTVNGIAISKDYIYLTTSSGYVNEPMPFYIFKHDGTLKHEDASIHDGSPPVIGKDGTVYVNIEYKLYAINPDGSIKWTVSHGIWRHPAPAIGPNADIYIISDDFLFSYNVDGKLNWKAQKGDDAGMPQTSPIIADDGTIYVSGYSSHKFSAFRADGTKKWDYTITVIQQPCIGPDGTIYFIGIKDRFDTQKILYALNPDGTLKWNLNGEFRTLMIDTNGKIFVQGWKDQKLYSINSEGKVNWTYDVGLSAIYLIDCSPVLNSNGDLYFVAEKRLGHSALYALTDISTKDTVDVSIADTNITFDPSLPITPGKEIIVDVVIKELSGKAAALCNVSFYLNNLTTLKETKSVYVTKDSPCTVQFKWNTGGLTPGNYTIFIVIDKVQPFEQNLTNNQAQKQHVLLRTIQSQIDAVTSGTITVKPGIYYENIVMKPNITLKSECGYDSTIIDGGSQTTVIDMPWWKDNMHIEGFTIRNGRTGIDMDSPYNASVRKCRVVNNNTGIYVYGIRGNNIVVNNIIENNTVGIDGNNPKFQIYNNTIVKNSGVGIKTIGYYEPTPDIDNCIIWGNGDDLGGTAKADYSCIEDRDSGIGNIYDNPLFVDYDHGDYRLQSNSPCIDRGNPDPKYNDQDGTRNDMGAYGGPGAIITKVDEHQKYQKTIPMNYAVAQNYPNPFNPETTIKYQLPKSSEVFIKIYNITGQLLKTLVDQKQPAGIYSITWDGKDELGQEVSSGVYFYQLRARSTKENFIETRKMILIR